MACNLQGYLSFLLGRYSLKRTCVTRMHSVTLVEELSVKMNIIIKSDIRLRSFGVIRIRISDPRSVWIMVHQRNR